jgi:hypothetical protein
MTNVMPKRNRIPSNRHIVELQIKPKHQHIVDNPEGESSDRLVKTSPGLQAQNKPSPKGKKPEVFSNDGYRISNKKLSKNQTKRVKQGLNPMADIVCISGTSIYPNFTGSITELQSWIQNSKGGSAFSVTNANSLLCHVKGLSITFYVNSGIFQINKGQQSMSDVENLSFELKNWCKENQDEQHDMYTEAKTFLEANGDHTNPNLPSTQAVDMSDHEVEDESVMPSQSKQTNNKRYPSPRTHNKQGLILAHLNIQGLQNRLNQLNHVLNNCDREHIDLLALSETWENHDNSSDFTAIKGYKFIGKPSTRKSRGIGFLISKKLSH